MPEANDTVAPDLEATETDAPQVNGTDVDESTVPDAPVEQVEQDKDWKAEAERLAKEQNKLQQELNLRRNKEKELERKALEESGHYKEAYEKLQEQLSEQEQQREQERLAKEAEDFRDKILNEYGEDVAKVAKDLNVWWDEASDYGSAENQLRTKLDAIKSLRPVKDADTEDEVEIHPNNPGMSQNNSELDKLSKMTAAEMRKILPIAER